MVIDSLINGNVSYGGQQFNRKVKWTKIIAHRANIGGPNSDVENNPDQIDKCIDQGYDVEIDLRIDESTKTLWLGHDTPDYKVTWYWLAQRLRNLWIHCKDYNTLVELSSHDTSKDNGFDIPAGGCNFFWHQEDEYTLTSNNIIWAYPGKPDNLKTSKLLNTVLVMPEWNKIDWESLKLLRCYGICTDYPEKLK
tara:strand:+ start:213 stop:794 length:582 start_codon:yes stop_codon:yes gene_type:complete